MRGYASGTDFPLAGRRPRRPRGLGGGHDGVKLWGRDVPRQVEVVFDYTTGVAREIARDDSGKILSTRVLHSAPTPSREEIAEAVALVSTDPDLGRMVSRTKAVPDGGFVLEQQA